MEKKAWSFLFFVLDEPSVEFVTTVLSFVATVLASEIFTSSGIISFNDYFSTGLFWRMNLCTSDLARLNARRLFFYLKSVLKGISSQYP